LEARELTEEGIESNPGPALWKLAEKTKKEFKGWDEYVDGVMAVILRYFEEEEEECGRLESWRASSPRDTVTKMENEVSNLPKGKQILKELYRIARKLSSSSHRFNLVEDLKKVSY